MINQDADCFILKHKLLKRTLPGGKLAERRDAAERAVDDPAAPPPPPNYPMNAPLRVRANTALFVFLATHNLMVSGGITCLGSILFLVKNLIAKHRLYDPRNPSMIICNQLLENILNVKALHVKQIREAILKSTVAVNLEGKQEIKTEDQSSESLTIQDQSSEDSSIQNESPESQADSETDGSEDEATTSSSTTVIKTEKKEDVNLYLVSPDLRKLLGLPAAPLTFQTIANQLSRYILAKKEELFDSRNIMVAIVNKDPLGAIFRVNAFHRSQVSWFLNKHLKQVCHGSSLVGDENSASVRATAAAVDEAVARKRKVVAAVVVENAGNLDTTPSREEREEETAVVPSANGGSRTSFKRCAEYLPVEDLPIKKRYVL